MNLIFATGEGMRDILSHKFRSFLTILGVVFGVSSLMTMFAITEGMTLSLRDRLQNTGEANKLVVNPGAPPPHQREIADRSPGITYRDVTALREVSPLINWISPVVSVNKWASYRSEGLSGRIVGTEESFLDMERMEVEHGRFLTSIDQENKARVAVLGSRYWKTLFPEGPEAALGKTIQAGGVSFTVVGTFPEYLSREQIRARQLGILTAQEARRKSRRSRDREWDPYPWKNQIMAIPLSTMQSIFKSANMQNGIDTGPDGKIDSIQIGVTDASQKKVVAEQIRNVLRMTHQGIEDFSIETYEESVTDIEAEVRATKMSGSIIAGIGLIVGGLGICNIMLASIVDRIREIGVRFAIGATPADIFIQVVMEALLLALIGAVLGILAGWGMVHVLTDVLRIPNQPVIQPEGVGLSFAFALVVGIMAGIYPAIKASRLKPVQALKFD